MFLKKQINPALQEALLASTHEVETAHLSCVMQLVDGRKMSLAGVKPLNRYSILPGKTFATSVQAKEKYKVLRVLADDVVIQNLATQKVSTHQVNNLLQEWEQKGLKEVSLLEDILKTVKSVLGPVLGIFLTAALVNWLTSQLGK